MEPNNHPILLTEDEYFYLSDRFEPLSAQEMQNGVLARFAVMQKQDMLSRLVRCVLETELSEEEQKIAAHLFAQGKTVLQTARDCALTRSRVQALRRSAGQKLEAYLKYPFLMDFNLLHPQTLFSQTLKDYGGK